MKLLTIDTKTNCYVIDSNEMSSLQQNIAKTISLSKGIFEIAITGGTYSCQGDQNAGEPLVLLWIYGNNNSTFVNQTTGYETGATWTTLNGYDDKLELEVKEEVVVCALFFDIYSEDNQGSIELTINGKNISFSEKLTIDSKQNCYLLNEGYLSDLQKYDSNYLELDKGNYKIKIREGTAGYWSEEKKFNLEPWALLWVRKGKFISELTGVEVGESWCSLNGLKDEIIIEVKEKTTISGLFFDTYKEDNEGQIILEIEQISSTEVKKEYDKRKANTTVSNTSTSSSSPSSSSTTVTIASSSSGSSSSSESMGVGVGFNFDENQFNTLWQQMQTQIQESVTIEDEKDEKVEAAHWDYLEKSILKGYQNQAKKLAIQVARVEFMLKTVTQQIEASFQQNYQLWSNYFNKNLNDLFATRVPRLIAEQVNVKIDDQTQAIKNLVIQQMQSEMDARVESIVNVKLTNQAQDIKNLVVQQMQDELNQRIDNILNIKMTDQAQQIQSQVVQQISGEIDRRLEDGLNIRIANKSQEITTDVIQQIQGDLDRRVEDVVTLKISDQTQNVKNLVMQQMQSYMDQRIDNAVNLKVVNQVQDLNAQVIKQIQDDIDRRIDAVVNLKIADNTQNIKNLVVQQIENDFEQKIKSVVNQSTDNSVKFIINNVLDDLDGRINVNLDNKMLNFRQDVSNLVQDKVNDDFANSLKTNIISDIKQQQFYVDMQSIKAEVENFYGRLGQFETNLLGRIEQGDTQLYNWTLEQLTTLQGCMTDRQALVERLEIFANQLKDELDGAECVQPYRFTPWVRREFQAQLESLPQDQLPQG